MWLEHQNFVERMIKAKGLPDKEQTMLTDLLTIYNANLHKNNVKNKYYEGRITLNDVNLGIALPDFAIN